MKTKLIQWPLTLLLLLMLCSCNFPSAQQATVDPYLMETIVAQNVQLTVLSRDLATAAAQTPTPASLPSEGLGSPTLTLTPKILSTPTPKELTLTINQNTNCRKGPANYYALVVTLKAGDKVVVLGRNAHSDYYNVLPSASASTSCWVWGNYATLSGNTGGLPVFTAVPGPTLTFTPTRTPTQAPSFSGSYLSLNNCGAEYSLRFYIKNSGNLTWQSITVNILDNSTSTTFSHSSNTFTDYGGCTAGVSQKDLAKGEDGYVATYNPGQFGYDPTGHVLTVTVTLFSEDDFKGTAASQTYTVTP
jgi:hypothetical protein